VTPLQRLRFLDVSLAWCIVLALNGLAAGCGGPGLTELREASRDRMVFSSFQPTPEE
jgi:hypothetical protein